MTFMALLFGVFNHSTFEKVHHFPHPRPTVEQTVPPTNPEPHHVLVALGTNEATPAKDLSAKDIDTKISRAASSAKLDAETRKPGRRPERLAHLHKPKVLVRQRQNNYEEHSYGMASGYVEGYRPGLDGQR
jgi:hypothetical protein